MSRNPVSRESRMKKVDRYINDHCHGSVSMFPIDYCRCVFPQKCAPSTYSTYNRHLTFDVSIYLQCFDETGHLWLQHFKCFSPNPVFCYKRYHGKWALSTHDVGNDFFLLISLSFLLQCRCPWRGVSLWWASPWPAVSNRTEQNSLRSCRSSQ